MNSSPEGAKEYDNESRLNADASTVLHKDKETNQSKLNENLGLPDDPPTKRCSSLWMRR